MKWEVTVERTEIRQHTFLVEAKTRKEAYELALDEAAANHNFNDDSLDSAVDKVTELTSSPV